MKRLFIVLVAATTIFASCNNKEIELKLNLEKGKTYIQTTNAEMSIKQTINGMPVDMSTTIDGSITHEVKDVQNSVYDIILKYKDLKMRMKTPFGSMEMDSKDKNPNNIMAQFLSNFIGQPINFKLNSIGKIEEISGMDSIYSKIFSVFKDKISEAEITKIVNQLKQNFGEESLKYNLELYYSIYPKNKVKKNDTWTSKVVLNSSMKMIVNSSYTLTEISSDYVVIKGKSDMVSDKNETFNLNGMQIIYDMKGSMDSEYKLDLKTGWIIDGTIKQNLKGEALTKSIENTNSKMKIGMEMNSNIKITDK
jgi:hypothetical protein